MQRHRRHGVSQPRQVHKPRHGRIRMEYSSHNNRYMRHQVSHLPPPHNGQHNIAKTQPQPHGTPFVDNGNGTPTTSNGGNGVGADAQGQSTSAPVPVPRTPAQQVLMSAADRWGLLGLLAVIKNADPDQALLSVGGKFWYDGAGRATARCALPLLLFLPYFVSKFPRRELFLTFITRWADSGATNTVEPDLHLPGCYNVQ